MFRIYLLIPTRPTQGSTIQHKRHLLYIVKMECLNEGILPFDPIPAQTAAVRWRKWLARLDNYLLAKNITSSQRKRAMLLHLAGEEVFDINVSLDHIPGDTYDLLTTKLTAYFAPQKNVEYEIFQFRNAKQEEKETLDRFHTRLRQLSQNCEFRDVEREIKSQLIQNCNDEKIRLKGLRDPAMTLENLITYGRTLEATRTQAQFMTTNLHDSNVNKISVRPSYNRNTNSGSASGNYSYNRYTNSGSASGNRSTNHSSNSRLCSGCGGQPHDRRTCPAWGRRCNTCKRMNHFAKVCRSTSNTTASNTNFISNELVSEDQVRYTSEDNLNSVRSEAATENGFEYDATLFYETRDNHSHPPYVYSVKLNGVNTSMEIDTGASTTIISEKQFRSICDQVGDVALENFDLPNLRTYSGHVIKPIGRVNFHVEDGTMSLQLSTLVTPGSGPNLLGRDWLSVMKLDWTSVKHVNLINTEVSEQFSNLFRDGLGTLTGTKVKLHMDANATPRFFRPRTVPYAYREKVEAELDRLQKDGVIRPVEFSEWAAPIVPVLKSNGEIRICGDYKLTVNVAVKTDRYPIPNIEDLYAKLAGGKYYTKLDLSHAYQQLCLDEDSQKLTTINTSKGLFVYTRLPFGISSAPGIFQRIIEQVVGCLPMTAVYLDDIMVTGHTKEEHDRNVFEVLSKLNAAGLRLRKDKCTFGAESVMYLGRKLDAMGIHPTKDRVKAILDAPAPQNVAQLRSYLGGLNFYHKFLRNVSTVLAPLHELLHQDVKWFWGDRQRRAFEDSKLLLQSSDVLVHFNPKQDIVLSCDASPYGIGCVMSHIMPDGSERPIAFASRTLSSAEKRYAQVEREALAVIYGITHFHKYLYGRRFIVLTDHKPLLGLLKEDRLISPMSSARMQRWGLMLNNYHYELKYRPGPQHGNSDLLSRLPVDPEPSSVPIPQEVILAIRAVEDSIPMSAAKIANFTTRDPTLSSVLNCVLGGWPLQCPTDEMSPYYRRKDELSCHDGCLLWGNRVLIPPQARTIVLQELHEAHPGIVRMKSLARSYVWWPGIDSDIENEVRKCSTCQLHRNMPAQAPVHPWEWPSIPWHRIHIDYAGPIENKWILIMVDAHSKYIEAFLTSSTSSQVTINKLRQSFATHGIPSVIVSDNATGFTSEEFETFCKNNGIKHTRSSPFHPSSNGLAERAVQTLKGGIQKLPGDLETRMYRFLSRYRTTPQTTTGRSPAELLMGRKPQTRLDLLLPSLTKKVTLKQSNMTDDHKQTRKLHLGDPVFALNFGRGPKWLSGVISEQLGPLTYTILLQDHRVWKRHVDHIRYRSADAEGDAEGEVI